LLTSLEDRASSLVWVARQRWAPEYYYCSITFPFAFILASSGHSRAQVALIHHARVRINSKSQVKVRAHHVLWTLL
jgi:hypothetical protein